MASVVDQVGLFPIFAISERRYATPKEIVHRDDDGAIDRRGPSRAGAACPQGGDRLYEKRDESLYVVHCEGAIHYQMDGPAIWTSSALPVDLVERWVTAVSVPRVPRIFEDRLRAQEAG